MKKTSVVLLPGLLCNAGLFINQINAFKERADFFVPDLGIDADIGSVARRILSQAPERFVLGGLSMGGYVALEIMRQAPERVSKLILMDTSAAPDAPQKRESRLKGIEFARQNGLEPLIKSALLDIVAPKNRSNEMLKAVLTHMALSTGVEGYANEQNVIMSRPDSRPDLPKISCPTLVFGGTEDALTPPESMKEIADAVPNALHAAVAGAGHLSPLEAPSAVNALFKAFLFQP